MRSLRGGLVAIVSGLCLLAVAASAGETPKKAPTLYQRLGGYDAIAAVTDDFIVRLATDPTLSRFFVGVGEASEKRIRQLVVDQICAATGGPCLYIGRDMKEVHKGLGISEKDWQTSVDLLVATLDKFEVGKQEKDELLAIVGTLKEQVVEAPQP